MFDQTFVEGSGKSKKPLTLVASTLIQISVLAVLLLIPLVYTATLPGPVLKSLLMAPAPPVAAVTPTAVKPHVGRVIRENALKLIVAPVAIPKQVSPINDLGAAPDVTAAAGVPGQDAVGSSLTGGMNDGLPGPVAPPEQPKPKPAALPRAIRVGSGTAEAKLINKVVPAYPALAKSARIQGSVEFSATISKDGVIENLQVVHGHPLLVNAARDAVLQWRYRPTLLNGQPVEVLTQIVVNFTLTQ